MYSSVNLMIYGEKSQLIKEEIKRMFVDSGLLFKELNSLSILFSAVKNPQNSIVIIVESEQLLKELENVVKNCYAYQRRVFVVCANEELVDGFFENCCKVGEWRILKDFIDKNIAFRNACHHQTSELLNKLIRIELENIGLLSKYVGFEYLVDLSECALCKNFYCNNYIEFYDNVASKNLSSVDTIERNVRHMLLSTWKNNPEFRKILKDCCGISSRINVKILLNGVLEYLKMVI